MTFLFYSGKKNVEPGKEENSVLQTLQLEEQQIIAHC